MSCSDRTKVTGMRLFFVVTLTIFSLNSDILVLIVDIADLIFSGKTKTATPCEIEQPETPVYVAVGTCSSAQLHVF